MEGMKKQCPTCKQTFEAKTAQKWCSLECRWPGQCPTCGAGLTKPSSHGGGQKRFCSRACAYDHFAPAGKRRSFSKGYVLVKTPRGTPGLHTRGRWMLEHRFVMQQLLGRPLTKHENVHHKNGRRDDNRPENLELWNCLQPEGVRAADYHCPGCRCFEGGVGASHSG